MIKGLYLCNKYIIKARHDFSFLFLQLKGGENFAISKTPIHIWIIYHLIILFENVLLFLNIFFKCVQKFTYFI